MRTALILTLLSVLSRDAASFDDIRRSTSVVSLIANPHQYNGKLVRTVGVVANGYDSTVIYMDVGSYVHHAHANGIWLAASAGEDILEILRDFDGKWVEIAGVFDSSSSGGAGQFVGVLTIQKITIKKPDQGRMDITREHIKPKVGPVRESEGRNKAEAERQKLHVQDK